MSKFRTTTKKLIKAEVDRILVKYQNTTAESEKEAKANFHELSEELGLFARLFDPTTALIDGREVAYKWYSDQCKTLRGRHGLI